MTLTGMNNILCQAVLNRQIESWLKSQFASLDERNREKVDSFLLYFHHYIGKH